MNSLYLIAALVTATSTFAPSTSAFAGSLPQTCLGCNMTQADLHGGNLRGVRYIGTNLSGANLERADLRDAKLIGVNFSNSNMQDANLGSSTLIGANFSGAKLEGASFRGAVVCVEDDAGSTSCINLRGANVMRTDFRGARFCRGHHQRTCSVVGAAMLREHGHSMLEGAILP